MINVTQHLKTKKNLFIAQKLYNIIIFEAYSYNELIKDNNT